MLFRSFLFLMRKKKYEKDKAHADEKLIVSEKIQEMIENILPIKAFGRKEKSMNELKEILEREEKQHLKSEFLNPLLLGPVSSLLRLGVISAILTGMGQYAAGNLSLSRLILLVIACATIYLPMDETLNKMNLPFTATLSKTGRKSGYITEKKADKKPSEKLRLKSEGNGSFSHGRL